MEGLRSHLSVKRGSIFFNSPVREDALHRNPCIVINVLAVETAEAAARKSALTFSIAA